MANFAAAGALALARGDYQAATDSYNNAIAQHPTSPDYYIKRSTAFQRRTPPDLSTALRDAELGVNLAHRRAKRELIAAAQLRRAIALYHLKKFADAQLCLLWSQQKNEKGSGLSVWLKKVEVELAKLAQDDDGRKITVTEVPDIEVSEQDTSVPPEKPAKVKPARNEPPITVGKESPVAGVQTPASKIRHEWYQTGENVVLTLLVKGAPKHKTTIDIHEHAVNISFPMPNASTFDFSLDPLFAPINTSTSTSNIMSTKIEVILKKSTPGQKWPSLEGTAKPAENGTDDSEKDTAASSESVKRAVLGDSSTSSVGPSYPTSSRSGPKDWDKVAADLTRKPKKPTSTVADGKTGDAATSEDAQDAPDEFDDDEEGDPVNGFFKKLYAGADPDTRRAMIKSYQESNGTALSTNWTEVGKDKVETTPPDGMEAKKWEG